MAHLKLSIPHFNFIIQKTQPLKRHSNREEMQQLGSDLGAVPDEAICQTCREVLLCVLLVLVRRRYLRVSSITNDDYIIAYDPDSKTFVKHQLQVLPVSQIRPGSESTPSRFF
jgi:hypothetical protein